MYISTSLLNDKGKLCRVTQGPFDERETEKVSYKFTTKCKVCVQPGSKSYTDPNFDEM